MRNIIVRHRQNGQLSNRPIPPHNASSPLVNRRQIGIHITRIPTPSRDLLPRRRNLTQRIGIRTHIRQNHQHMQIPLIRQILRRRKRKPWRNNTLNGGIVRQVQKQGGTLHRSTLLEITAEESCRFHVHSHGTKDNGKVLLVGVEGVLELDEGGLSGDLGSHFVVWEAGGGEDGDFLTTGDRVHDVDD